MSFVFQPLPIVDPTIGLVKDTLPGALSVRVGTLVKTGVCPSVSGILVVVVVVLELANVLASLGKRENSVATFHVVQEATLILVSSWVLKDTFPLHPALDPLPSVLSPISLLVLSFAVHLASTPSSLVKCFAIWPGHCTLPLDCAIDPVANEEGPGRLQGQAFAVWLPALERTDITGAIRKDTNAKAVLIVGVLAHELQARQ